MAVFEFYLSSQLHYFYHFTFIHLANSFIQSKYVRGRTPLEQLGG